MGRHRHRTARRPARNLRRRPAWPPQSCPPGNAPSGRKSARSPRPCAKPASISGPENGPSTGARCSSAKPRPPATRHTPFLPYSKEPMSCCQPGLFPQVNGMTSVLSSLVIPCQPRQGHDMTPGPADNAPIRPCQHITPAHIRFPARLTSMTTHRQQFAPKPKPPGLPPGGRGCLHPRLTEPRRRRYPVHPRRRCGSAAGDR